jgi:hypothetical protein
MTCAKSSERAPLVGASRVCGMPAPFRLPHPGARRATRGGAGTTTTGLDASSPCTVAAVLLLLPFVCGCAGAPSGAVPQAPPAQLPLKVFIVSGQSNAVGAGNSLELPPALREGNDRVLMFHGGRWQPLRPFQPAALSQRIYGLTEYTFGPEIGFGAAMAEAWPDVAIGIIKVAEGGEKIASFLPGADPARRGDDVGLYEIMMRELAAAREQRDFEVAGFLWMQGAADMQVLTRGLAYYPRLVTLIECVRRDTGVPDLPFLIGTYRTGDTPDDLEGWVPNSYDLLMAGAPSVMRAKWRASREIPNVRLVIARDLPKHRDERHFNTEGQLELGRLFAKALLEGAESISNNQ